MGRSSGVMPLFNLNCSVQWNFVNPNLSKPESCLIRTRSAVPVFFILFVEWCPLTDERWYYMQCSCLFYMFLVGATIGVTGNTVVGWEAYIWHMWLPLPPIPPHHLKCSTWPVVGPILNAICSCCSERTQVCSRPNLNVSSSRGHVESQVWILYIEDIKWV